MDKQEDNISTEEKIKEAARIVFTKKGYAATKTRDIAEQAGLNLALLNYYFRSKEKLFEIIMREKIQQLVAFIYPLLDDATTTLEEKIERISVHYIDMLLKNPDLPLFVLSEIRNNPEKFESSVKFDTYILKSYFMRQLAERSGNENPLQYFLTFLGMLIFPFVIKPVLQVKEAVNEQIFTAMMEERKVLISQWMKMVLK